MIRSIVIGLALIIGLIGLGGDGQATHNLDGEPCPDWVHDHYLTTGPDGNEYATWHPLTDAETGCVFGHEHGVDPGLFWPDYKPAYNYTANQAGMNEPHHGFKNFVFRGNDRTTWLLTVHMGSTGHGRACTQFHTLDVAVVDHTHPARIVADLHLLGDFGAGQVWNDGNNTIARIPDSTCPGNSEIASDGLRRFSDASSGGAGYEVWRTDSSELSAVGVAFGHTHLSVNDPLRICDDADCETMVEKHPSFGGVDRNITIARGPTDGLRIENPGNNAEFSTNVYGTDKGSVPQYIEPGTTWTAQDLAACKDVGGPVGMPMFCGDVNPAGIITDRSLIEAPN